MYRASKYGHHLLIAEVVIWINRVKLPNLLVVSCIRGKYIHICTGTVLLFVLVCIPGIFFIWGHVHLCTVHCLKKNQNTVVV